eukprot:TRINITY_DN85894_c0_g1_i2.p1 TRINITY_DN85894_c0_g1~~TRINITY_DN85894_c0_g1_i2.p1  ORF type:complete len:237 (+),score=42.51 TRINITY_DN85894_c0_g1_i2:46-711(+)
MLRKYTTLLRMCQDDPDSNPLLRQGREPRFTSVGVCTNYVVGFCPQEALLRDDPNTYHVGPCGKVHDPEVRREWANCPFKFLYLYEFDFLNDVECLVYACDGELACEASRMKEEKLAAIDAQLAPLVERLRAGTATPQDAHRIEELRDQRESALLGNDIADHIFRTENSKSIQLRPGMPCFVCGELDVADFAAHEKERKHEVYLMARAVCFTEAQAVSSMW